jgi:hypothetical protein
MVVETTEYDFAKRNATYHVHIETKNVPEITKKDVYCIAIGGRL